MEASFSPQFLLPYSSNVGILSELVASRLKPGLTGHLMSVQKVLHLNFNLPDVEVVHKSKACMSA